MQVLATFASLRWGEATALRRCDVDLDTRTVSIRHQYVELSDRLILGPPKSRAGRRTVGIPKGDHSRAAEHFDAYVGSQETDLVFTGARGGCCRPGHRRRARQAHQGLPQDRR